jgi:hypothetical protein
MVGRFAPLFTVPCKPSKYITQIPPAILAPLLCSPELRIYFRLRRAVSDGNFQAL